MYELYFKIIAATGGVSLLFALGLYQWHQEVELFAAISALCWGVLTFTSDNLIVLTDSGATETFESFPMQLVAAGLTLISVLAVLGAVTGRWPADSRSRKEAPV